MVSTLEEFRTTYERFETNYEQNSYKFQEESKDGEELEDLEEHGSQEHMDPAQFFVDNSIETIKPVDNKQSFSFPMYHESTSGRHNEPRGNIRVRGIKFDSYGNAVGLENSRLERDNKLTMSIIQKLEALDFEDAGPKVVRGDGLP